MKEISCEISFSQEIWDLINTQMNEQGKIKIGNCEEALVEVMPIEQKNFINEVQPVIELILNLGSQIAIGLVVNWIYDMLKGKIDLVINGHQVKSKEEITKAIEENNHEK